MFIDWNRSRRISGTCRGFTLLELLAAIALLILLGSMLFQIFDQASMVMRLGSGRQEILENARVLFEHLGHEISGVIGISNSGPDGDSTPFRIEGSEAGLGAFENRYNVSGRKGSDALSFTAGVVGRDGIADSPTRGQVANVANVAYWLSPGDQTLHRYESYRIDQPATGRGWDFALNVLEFRIEVLDQWEGDVAFKRKDWDSSEILSSGVRRGLPAALRINVKLCDRVGANLYEFDENNECMVPKSGAAIAADPIVREFSHVICFSEN